MESFLSAFAGFVIGVLNGFDRLVFRGHLRQLCTVRGMECHLSANHVLCKDFETYVQGRTQLVVQSSLSTAAAWGRPVEYVHSTRIDKEKVALQIAARDGVKEGLICVLKCVEPCVTYEMHRNRQKKLLELQGKYGKCTFLYHYHLHPQFGLLYGRVQTWFPFSIQIGLNGREWLAQQLAKEGLKYRRYDNKVTWVDDLPRAQQLLDAQLEENWPERLDEIRRLIHPTHPDILGAWPMDYYWSAFQTEWASDVLLPARADRERIFPQLVRHALMNFRSAEILTFLGRKEATSGRIHGRFAGEVQSKFTRRPEGACIKHWVNGNSLKTYDGPGFIRFETTINNPHDFKVYRTRENDPDGELDWRILRKGVADMHRRAIVCQAANDRYAQAYAAMKDTTPLKKLIDPLCRRALAPGKNPQARKVRGLNPMSPADAAVLEAILDPRFAVSGLRNRDLVAILYPQSTTDPKEQRRRSGRVTRLIRLLRGHGLLNKVPKSHRYQMSESARKLVTALLSARNANAESLAASAA